MTPYLYLEGIIILNYRNNGKKVHQSVLHQGDIKEDLLGLACLELIALIEEFAVSIFVKQDALRQEYCLTHSNSFQIHKKIIAELFLPTMIQQMDFVSVRQRLITSPNMLQAYISFASTTFLPLSLSLSHRNATKYLQISLREDGRENDTWEQ